MAGKKRTSLDRDGGDRIPEQSFDRWLNRQLHKLYDPVLSEEVPDEIMRLLQEFDDPTASEDTADQPAPDKSDPS